MKKNKLLIGLLSLVVFAVIGMTSAFLTSEASETNKFSIGNIDIEVEEEFTPPTDWNGEAYSKKVQIENKSNGPVLIRVNITPRWVDENGSAWAGDTSLVNLNFVNLTSSHEAEKWLYGGDANGYYYYTTKLQTQGKTSLLLESVSLKQELPDIYKGKMLIVDVNAEAVQATKEAFEDVWKGLPEHVKNLLDIICN